MELITGQPLNRLIVHFSGQSVATASPTKLADIFRETIVGPPTASPLPDMSGDSSDASFSGIAALVEAPGNVRLDAGVTGLARDSVVNVSQLLTLDRSLLAELMV